MKRLLAVFLSISLVLGTLTYGALSAETESQINYAGMGDYTVVLQSDPKTDEVPSDFGTAAANGKVWTDKSVAVNEDHFEVTLSALAQEYISENKENSTSSVAADVVMILDLSASMQSNTLTLDNVNMTRTKAMIKAVNEALEIIMRANDNNRALIYTYQSDSNGTTPITNELLPLGHYTNTSWDDENMFSGNNGKYFNYSSGSSSDTIRTSANLKRDGVAFAQKSLSTSYGTCTQHGILKGVQSMKSAIEKESKSVERKPYILLFTDGVPGNANKSWYNSSSTGCSFSHSNSGTAEISALSVLSAAYMKNSLNDAYCTYNGKDIGIEWFNIGLGVGNNELGTLFLQPSTIASGTSDNAKNVRTNIAKYTSGQYSAYDTYATDYTYTANSYIVASGNDLEDAFTELASKIEEETKSIISPIITTEGAVSDLTFTDTIGAGMSVTNIKLHSKDGSAISGAANGNEYSFDGYDMTATITTDVLNRSVLSWNIPADEVAIFAFANRADPTDGVYIPSSPIRLTYDVEVANPNSYEGARLYSNAEAKAEFSIPDDNTFYYNADGTIKTTPFEARVKGQNITGLSDYSIAYTSEPISVGASIVATLGNNGLLRPATLLEKFAEDSNIETGTDVTFTLAVTNKMQTNLSNVIVTDTLPSGLTYKAGSVQNATVNVDNLILTFTIPSIDAGQTVTVTYDTLLSAYAEAGEAFTNTAAVSRINQLDVYGPSEASSTITAYRTYRVIYEWSGNIPTGPTLPTDNNRYVPGAYYQTDTTYTPQTKLETKDRFDNVTERWTFSGWEDSGRGLMGEADVIIRGVWSYEAFTYPAHKVFYTWSGDIPPDKTPPVDQGTYVKNQPYSVDSTYTAEAAIETYDTYGNVNGRYIFSGWNDPNHAVMGDSDVTISGVWRFEPVNVTNHRVIYIWSGDIPAGQALPTDNSTYAPNQTYPVDATYSAATEILSYDNFGNLNGRYTFSGWNDPNNTVMGDSDVTISGVWHFESLTVPHHRVFYVWTGEIPPSETLPSDGNTYVKNQSYPINDTYTAATVIPTYDDFGNMNGRYTFSGWNDANNGIMGDADVTIRGVWEFETVNVPTHKVIYTWTGEFPPDAIIPTDVNTYVKNQAYPVDTTYSSISEVLTHDAYGNVNGKYTFSGWDDPNGKIMGDTDVTIRGIWKFETVNVPTHKVIYTWTGTIPTSETLPTDQNYYVKGQAYSIDTTYDSQTERCIYDAYGNLTGRYTFSGWNDSNDGIMDDADITVYGIWEFEAVNIPAHRVFYVWSGEVPPDKVLPTDDNTYVKNQTYSVDTTFTKDTVILTYDIYGNINGKYTFSGWDDPNDKTMGDADVIIRGVWKFESVDVPPMLIPPEETPLPEHDVPKTGENLPLKWFLAIWVLTATVLLFLCIPSKKKNTQK